MFLIVGLGNPGREYEGTRHNVGFEVIDLISKKLEFDVSRIKFKGLIGEHNIKGQKCFFIKPSTFMNLSGESVREAADFYKISPDKIIVVYDDVSINLGRIRIRPSGSDGGHNGMKSIIYHLNSNGFPRIRIGIGDPQRNMISHVLGRFAAQERDIISDITGIAVQAVLDIIENGVNDAMNRYNSYKAGQE